MEEAIQTRPVLTKKNFPITIHEKGAELKKVYGLQGKADFLEFAKEWDDSIQTFDEIITNMDSLHSYVENHPEKFEVFVKKTNVT